MSEEKDEQPAVRSYSSKSKAKRGLQTFTKMSDENIDAAAEKLLFQYGDKAQWSFYEDDATNYFMSLQAESDEAIAPTATVEELNQEAEQTNSEPETEHTEPQNGAGVFGAMANTMQNAPQAAPSTAQTQQRNHSRSQYKIEKNRPEQNGIKRPSAGGLCREVWDAMDAMREQQAGAIPTSQQVRALAEGKGWNKNNAMIEFYQWRKFNGITGRAQKAPQQPETTSQPQEQQA